MSKFKGFLALLLVFGLFMTSCEEPSPSGGEDTPYTVSFNSNGGSGTIPSVEALAGTTISLPDGSGLSRSGYAFVGWNTNSSGTGTDYSAYSVYTVNGNVTLYAKWSPVGSNTPVTVSFNSNGGNGTVQPMQTLAGTSIILPDGDGLSRSGYTFGGWNTNSSGTGTDYSAYTTYTVNSNVTLYAKWSPVSSNEIITLEPNGSYGWLTIYDQSILNGTRITAGDEYIFKYSFRSNVAMDYLQIVLVDNSASGGSYKWDVLSDYIDVEGYIPANTVISGEVYLYAIGTATNTTATANRLVLQAGPGTASQPTLTFTNLQLIKADEVGHTYTITFNSNGGSGTVPSITAGYGDSITLPSGSGFYYSSGYTFGYWFEYGGSTYNAGASYTVYGDATLYAYWYYSSGYTYMVTFDSNGGSAVASQSINDGETVARPAANPTKAHYVFDDWYSDSDLTTLYNFDTPVYYDITVYARWEPIWFAVTFEANGGTINGSSTVQVHSGNSVNPPLTPTMTGYTFDEWYSNSALTDVYDFDTPVASDFTLYAKWNRITHTVSFNSDMGSNQGSAVNSQTVNSGETATRPTVDPSFIGFTFDNWYSDSDLTTLYNFDTPVTSDITLYAKYNQIYYLITFESNIPNTAAVSHSMYHGGWMQRPVDPIRSGYTFAGWYTDLALTTLYNFNTPVTSAFWLYAKWEEQGSYVLTIDFVPDAAPVITGPIIYISGDGDVTPTSATITLANPSRYGSINWYIPGTGISVSGPSITLSVDNAAYNTPGEHALTVEVKVNGVPYGRTVIFTVEE